MGTLCLLSRSLLFPSSLTKGRNFGPPQPLGVFFFFFFWDVKQGKVPERPGLQSRVNFYINNLLFHLRRVIGQGRRPKVRSFGLTDTSDRKLIVSVK